MKLLSSATACGKINLRLKVTARRADGYHELDTIFYPLDFPADKIALYDSGTSGVTFDCEAFPDLPAENNLAVRAALRYAERAGITPNWHITLDKKLPIAAGVGGGSSDAAAVLRSLNEVYNKISEDELAEIAVKLGADVPFFLKKRPMRATGIGEKLVDFELPGNMPEILLIYPGFPVSAKWAYQHLEAEHIGQDAGATPADYRRAFAEPDKADWEYLVRNDLAFALWKKFPLCTLLKNFILARDAWTVQISGSGSSLFALFPDKESAAKCASELRESDFGNSYTRIFTGGKEW